VTAELPSGVGTGVALLELVLLCFGVGLGETLDAPDVGLFVCWPFVVVRKVGTGVTGPAPVGEDVGVGVAGDLVRVPSKVGAAVAEDGVGDTVRNAEGAMVGAWVLEEAGVGATVPDSLIGESVGSEVVWEGLGTGVGTGAGVGNTLTNGVGPDVGIGKILWLGLLVLGGRVGRGVDGLGGRVGRGVDDLGRRVGLGCCEFIIIIIPPPPPFPPAPPGI